MPATNAPRAMTSIPLPSADGTPHHHGGEACCGDSVAGGHHSHAHPDMDRRLLWIALIIIGGFAVVEVIGGLLAGSLALIADAGHMVTDAAAIVLALGAKWLAAKPATERYPFGLKRAPVLASFVNALALFALIAWLLLESFYRLRAPGEVASGTMLVVALLGLVANIAAFAILHRGNRSDLNMRGALLHVAGDILGSLAAIGAALVIMATGWTPIDPILTVVVCVLIARSAWHLLADATAVLMQAAPPGLEAATVAQSLRHAVPEVQAVHGLESWMLTPDQPHLSARISVAKGSDQATVVEAVKAHLAESYGVTSAILEVAPASSCSGHAG